MSSQEDVNTESSIAGSNNSGSYAENANLFEPKAQPKVIRVLTVLAYILSVSMAAILLSIYYIFMWDGKPHLGARRAVSYNEVDVILNDTSGPRFARPHDLDTAVVHDDVPLGSPFWEALISSEGNNSVANATNISTEMQQQITAFDSEEFPTTDTTTTTSIEENMTLSDDESFGFEMDDLNQNTFIKRLMYSRK